MDILVPIGTLYVGFLEILFQTLELNIENYTLWIKYIFEFSCSPFKIVNDHAVKFYMELKNIELDNAKFPLCVRIWS